MRNFILIMLLDNLPKDLVVLIFTDWLSAWIDLSSFDKALTNKESRQYFYAHNSFTYPSGEHISSKQKLADIERWKDKRSIQFNKIILNKFIDVDFNCVWGGLTVLELVSCVLGLQTLFNANLLHLKKLTCFCSDVSIIYEEVMLLESLPPMNIEVLEFRCSRFFQKCGRISFDNCSKAFLWIARCCPKLKKLHLHQCHDIFLANLVPMIRALPQLQELFCDSSPSLSSQVDISTLGMKSSMDNNLPLIPLTKLTLFCHRYFKEVLKVLYQCDQKILEELGIAFKKFTEQDELLQFLQNIQNYWQNIKCLRINSAESASCCATVLTTCFNTCLHLNTLYLYSMTLSDLMCTYFTEPNILFHLHSLHLEEVAITDEGMKLIGISSVAQHLTSLELKTIRSLSVEAYRLIALSFPQLKELDLKINCFARSSHSIDRQTIYFATIQWLNVLFGTQCAFAKQIESLSLNVPTYLNMNCYCDETLAYNGFCDHMLIYWKFPFPALKRFLLDWKINHHAMNSLLAKRIVQCPLLHTIVLDVYQQQQQDRREVDEEEEEKEIFIPLKFMEFYNQREIIRKMSE